MHTQNSFRNVASSGGNNMWHCYCLSSLQHRRPCFLLFVRGQVYYIVTCLQICGTVWLCARSPDVITKKTHCTQGWQCMVEKYSLSLSLSFSPSHPLFLPPSLPLPLSLWPANVRQLTELSRHQENSRWDFLFQGKLHWWIGWCFTRSQPERFPRVIQTWSSFVHIEIPISDRNLQKPWKGFGDAF